MKIFLLVLLLSSQLLTKKVNTEFLSFISTSASIQSSQDAINAVLQLLNDLKGANEEIQRKADADFEEYEHQALADLSDFTAIMNENNKSVEKNQEDLDDIEDKIAQTKDYLDWNEKRRSSNNNKLEILAEQRCEANSLFIDNLREYREALSVLDWIKSDVESKDQSFIEKPNEYADKLSLYASMFKENEINEFVKLGENDIEMTQTKQNSGSNEELANKVISEVVKKVEKLIEKIREALKNLEDQEITSANDFVDFRSNLLGEQAQLIQEYDSRVKFLHSLINDQEMAQEVVTQCQEILHNTQRILQQTQDQYNQQRQNHETEKQKRHEENQMIEEIAEAKLFLQEQLGDSYVQINDDDD